MINPDQEIAEIPLTKNKNYEFYSIYVKVLVEDFVLYDVGNYFQDTKQISFHGVRLTNPQIIKILVLIETAVNNEQK